MTAHLPWQRAFSNESWVQLTAHNISWCVTSLDNQGSQNLWATRNDREGKKHRSHDKPRQREKRQGGTSSLTLSVARGAPQTTPPREQRMKGCKSYSPHPKTTPTATEKVVRGKKVTAAAHYCRPGRRETSAGLAAGARCRVRGAGRATPLSSRDCFLLPSSLPSALSSVPGGDAAGRFRGSRVGWARASPPLRGGSEAAPAAPRRPGPARARPPRVLTLRAVVEAVELPVRGQGLQRHRRRSGQQPPDRPWLRRTGLPAPRPRRTPGNGGGGEPGLRGRRRDSAGAALPPLPASLRPPAAPWGRRRSALPRLRESAGRGGGAGRDAPMPAVGRRVRSPLPLTPCSLSRSCWVRQGWPRRHRGFGSFSDFRLGLGTPAQSLWHRLRSSARLLAGGKALPPEAWQTRSRPSASPFWCWRKEAVRGIGPALGRSGAQEELQSSR